MPVREGRLSALPQDARSQPHHPLKFQDFLSLGTAHPLIWTIQIIPYLCVLACLEFPYVPRYVSRTCAASIPDRAFQELVNSQPGWLCEVNALLQPFGS